MPPWYNIATYAQALLPFKESFGLRQISFVKKMEDSNIRHIFAYTISKNIKDNIDSHRKQKSCYCVPIVYLRPKLGPFASRAWLPYGLHVNFSKDGILMIDCIANSKEYFCTPLLQSLPYCHIKSNIITRDQPFDTLVTLWLVYINI